MSSRGTWLLGGLSPNAVQTYAALSAGLARLADTERTTPCQGRDSELWTSEHHEDREAAAWRCQTCPLLNLCQIHGNTEHYNAWGGADRAPHDRKKAHPMTQPSSEGPRT